MKLNKKQIIKYAKKYDSLVRGTPDEKIEKELRKWFTKHSFLDKNHFVKLCLWKSPRAKRQYLHKINREERIKEITSFALNSKDEYARIMSLQLLKGVSWGVASTILHFAYPKEYSILDFRAIWSMGWNKPKQYNFDFWMKYTNKFRELGKSFKIPLRVIDKALWQYSRENQ